ncbi:HNH endonuclease signature motif containing protein [Luteimonas sp. A611]
MSRPCTNLAPAWPIPANLPRVRDVILHWQSRLLVWPAKGVVYGRLGRPVGAVCADGYVRLGGRPDGLLYAHRLIWEVVHGPIPARLVIDHLNGQRADNRIRNLDAVTPSENMRRAIASGAVPVGAERTDAKLNDDLVCEIRASDLPSRVWAQRLGMAPRTIRQARGGTTWRHVVCRGGRSLPSRRRGGSA